MPRAGDARVDSYVAILEMALLDGFLAEHEKDQLVEVALAEGLTRGQLIDIHGSYLTAMAEVALGDDIVTPEERGQLDTVASALGLTSHDVDAALTSAQCQLDRAEPAASIVMGRAGIVLQPGDRIVFTGDMVRERSEWEAITRAAGLEPVA